MKRSVYNNTLVKASLHPATRTATATGASVDRIQDRQWFRTAMVIVHSGAITDGTHTIEVQESDDDATFTAVAATHLESTAPEIGSTDNDTVYEIGYLGNKRYLRVVSTVAGATSGGDYAAVVVLGQPSRPPVTRS